MKAISRSLIPVVGIVLFSLLCTDTGAQTLSNQVIASAGMSGGLTNTVHWTIGETFVVTYVSDAKAITEGFHQPRPETCPNDINNDGVINANDLLTLLADIGCTGICVGDLNGDGVVNTGDLLNFLAQYGEGCPS